MKTDDLISLLAADREPSGPAMNRLICVAAASGMLVSLVLFAATLGLRPDISSALQTWRFDVKFAIAVVAVAAAVIDCLRSMRPQVEKAYSFSLVAVALLAVAVVIELAAVPPSEWQARVVGTNGLMCLISIPALSLVPLVVLLRALRAGAPASPAGAGAAIGVLSAACGALLYATHCSDDSPLFVATWYLMAAVPVIGLGAVAGSRLLKW